MRKNFSFSEFYSILKFNHSIFSILKGFWATAFFWNFCVLSRPLCRGVHLCLVTTVVGNISGQNIGTSVHQIELTIHRPLTATTKCLCVDPRLAYGRKTCDNRSYSKCQTCLLWVKNREKDFLMLVQNVLLLLLELEQN